MINLNFVKKYNYEQEILMTLNGLKANISKRREHTLADCKDMIVRLPNY